MEEKCLRNMSCKCRLCAGEDISMLLNITKSISSNIQYEAGEDGADMAVEAPSGVSSSPPVPSARRGVANSPPVPGASAPPRAMSRPPPARFAKRQQAPVHVEPMEVEAPEDDVTMADALPSMVSASSAPMEISELAVAPPPAPMVQMRMPGPPMPESMDTEMTAPTPPPKPVAMMPSTAPTAMGAEFPQAVEATIAPSGEIPSTDALIGQLADKNWKVRKEAYEHVKALCEKPGTRGDDVSPLLESFSKMCEDSNASAMDAGIQAVLAYTQRVEPFHKGVVAGVMKRIVDKGFASRPGTVKLCEELVSSFIEAGAAEDTIAALIEGTKNKKPKVPPACASGILEGLKAFGPRVIPVQSVKGCLPTLCESTVNGVRPIALNILAEIHRWVGPGLIQDVVSNLRQAQQTEYEGLTKDIVLGQAQPTKYVRGAKPPAASAARGAKAGPAASAGAGAGSAGFDPREFAETVNLLDKLPRTEFRAKLALPKWSEKVEALKIVLDLIGSVPKLANGDYYELVNTLKLLSNDSNVNIVAKSIEVLGALADGLRKNFTQYARLMYPELMKKLSDKKSVILNAVNNSLDAFLQYSMSIDMMMDEIRFGVDASKNKAPQARVQTIGFLARCVEKRLVNIADRNLITDFGSLFVSAMEDIDPTVRKAAVDSFVALVKATEQTPDYTSGLMEDVSRKNPRSFKAIQQGLGNSGSGSAPPSRPSSAGSTGRAPSIPDADIPDATPAAASRAPAAKPTRGPPGRLAGKAPEAAKKPVVAARKAAPGATASASAGAGVDFTPFSISVAPEEAEDILLDLQMDTWGAITEGFASSKWMERKAAIEQLEEFAKQNSGAMSVRVIEAMTVFMSKQVKDFKDSNINVLKSAFQAVGTFAEHTAGKFPRGVVCLAVPGGVDKIADRKLAETVRAMILQLCEAVGPTYVLGCIVSHMANVKAPLAHAEVLTAINECAADFGVALCSPRLLIDYAKGSFGLESSNPKVRTNAIALLATMYSQLGPALLPILNLESWKPALASIVEAEFKKVGFDPANAAANVKRQIKDADELAAGAKADSGALFGRADISAQITKELMADLKCEDDKTAWKKRLAAMESVQSICEAAGCAIEFTKPVIELMKAMKARMTDSNANLKIKAAQVIGVLATSIGPEVAKMSKLIGPSLLSGVSDNKKNMQLASVETLHKWVRHNNQTSSQCLDSLISSVAEAMMNPVGRAELLGWLAEHLRAIDQRIDLASLITPTVHGGLLDKSSEAREKAVQVLAEVVKSVGKDTVLSIGCRDIKPAQMRSLKPLIDKAVDIAAASAPAPSMPAPVAVAPPAQVVAPPAASGDSSSRLARTNSMPNRPGARPLLSRASGSLSVEGSIGERTPVRGEEPSPVGAMLKMNGGKSSRLAKGQFNKWIFDPISQSEMNNRKNEIETEWRPFLSPEFHAKLFAPTLEKGMMAAMSDLMTCISSQPQEVLAALDLIFKWCTLRVVDNNVQALAKLLEVLVKLFELLKSIGYHLDDVEAAILLPYLLQESGNPKPRFKVRFRDIMRLVVDVYSTDSYINYLVDCFNNSKNIKSRCECIDLVEHIVKTHGVNAVGKRSVKEIGKYVTAHEKEIRESAINALIAVYLKMGGDVDRFFRFTGVTSQQGMDLLATKIKYLPPGALAESAAAAAPAAVQAPVQKVGFGFAAPSAQNSFSARTPPRMPTTAANASTPMSGQKTFNNVPMAAPSTTFGAPVQAAPPQHFGLAAPQDDDDVLMVTPGKEEQSVDPAVMIHDLLMRPLDELLTAERDIVSEFSPAYAPGVEALKGLYTIALEPNEEAEKEFLHRHVNEIAMRLCECIHGSMGRGDPNKPLSLLPLTISLSTLRQLLESTAIEDIQRYVVERILLETTSKLLDARFEDTPIRISVSSAEFGALPVDRRRLIFMQKGLNAILAISTKKIRAGDLYPSIVNLLQRIVRNDVGEYNARDSFNHLMHKDSLDQVVGRLLLKITNMQAEALNPFEGIDIFGVLMQMHSFFSTLPQSDVFSVQIANDNMQQALKVIAECMMKTRKSSFEAAVNDLPPDSPIRDLLGRMGFAQSLFSSSRGLGSSRYGGNDTSVASSFSSVSAQPPFGAQATSASSADSITRRLFDAGSSPSSARVTAASATASSRLGSFRSSGFGASADGGIRSSLTSSSDTNGHRTSTISSLGDFAREAPQGSSAATQAATSRDLRQRLERFRAAK